jgi:hypothetical protein
MASRTAATSTSSKACVGTQVTRLARPAVPAAPGALQQPRDPLRASRPGAPGRPAGSRRPGRGSRSPPRSQRPSAARSSTQSRGWRSSEPWCSATSPAQSGRAASSAWYQISVCERVLVKTSVLALLDRLDHLRQQGVPRCPAQGNRSMRRGDQRVHDDLLPLAADDDSASGRAAVPEERRRASPRLPSVAETPQVRMSGRPGAERASASSVMHAALGAHQLVPLVHDHAAQAAEQLPRRRG